MQICKWHRSDLTYNKEIAVLYNLIADIEKGDQGSSGNFVESG
jgi:hypothetical protein